MFRHWTKPSISCGEAEILYQRFQFRLLVNAAFKNELSNFRLQRKENLGTFVNLSVWRGYGEILRAVLFVVSSLQPSLSKGCLRGYSNLKGSTLVVTKLFYFSTDRIRAWPELVLNRSLFLLVYIQTPLLDKHSAAVVNGWWPPLFTIVFWFRRV